MHIEVSLEATKSDSKCVPPTTTSSLEKETTHQTHDSHHQRHEMKQSQCEDELHTATFNTAARSPGTRRRSQLGCMFGRRERQRWSPWHERSPTRRGMRCVPDASGRNTKYTSEPTRACSLAKRHWHSSATSVEGNPDHGIHHRFSADFPQDR